jgi:hypothetical protein
MKPGLPLGEYLAAVLLWTERQKQLLAELQSSRRRKRK